MDPGIADRTFAPSRQRWFLSALVLLFIGVSIQYSVKAMANRSAILRWRDQLHHLGDENIYERYTYPNPPIMAILLEPIARLRPLPAALLWFYCKAMMAMLSIHWVFRLVESPGRPFPEWAKALTIVLSLRPIVGDLSHGNVNLFILFLVVGALYAFRQGRDVLCGVAIGLAIACKVTPALFVPYFLWKRAWRALAGTAAGMVLFFVLVPGLFLGQERNLNLLSSWVNQMVTPYLVAGNVTTEHQNQSLPGLVFRMMTHSPSFLNEREEPARYDNWVDWDPRVVQWVVKGCMALFALAVVWRCRTPTLPRGGWRLAAEFSLVLVGMLLFSERTWKHHCVTLLLPFGVISYYLAACRPGRGLQYYLAGTLVLIMLVMASTSTTLFEAFDAKQAQVYGAYVWAELLLVAALLVLLGQPEAPAREPAAGRQGLQTLNG